MTLSGRIISPRGWFDLDRTALQVVEAVSVTTLEYLEKHLDHQGVQGWQMELAQQVLTVEGLVSVQYDSATLGPH